MKTSKYKGGSVLTTFRLPKEAYNSTRARLNKVLDEIAKELKEKDKNSVKSITASVKTTLDKKPIHKPIMYKCGCNITENIFRRSEHCKIGRLNH